MHACMDVCMYVCIIVYIYVYIYICIYICINIYICVYIRLVQLFPTGSYPNKSHCLLYQWFYPCSFWLKKPTMLKSLCLMLKYPSTHVPPGFWVNSHLLIRIGASSDCSKSLQKDSVFCLDSGRGNSIGASLQHRRTFQAQNDWNWGTSMAISINGGIQKWMVYFMENPIKMDDLEVLLFQETTIYIYIYMYIVYIYIYRDPMCSSEAVLLPWS